MEWWEKIRLSAERAFEIHLQMQDFKANEVYHWAIIYAIIYARMKHQNEDFEAWRKDEGLDRRKVYCILSAASTLIEQKNDVVIQGLPELEEILRPLAGVRYSNLRLIMQERKENWWEYLGLAADLSHSDLQIELGAEEIEKVKCPTCGHLVRPEEIEKGQV